MKLRDCIDRELENMTPDKNILQDILKRDRARLLPKPGLILCAALLALAFVIPVSANMFGMIGNTTRITDENRALIEQPDIASASEAPADTEKLEVLCSIGDTAGNGKAGSSKTMEFGYIENYVFREGEIMQERNFSYTLTAPEDGVYYPYCINCFSGKIYITGGEIR